ncbi:MAG: hypothetical protein WAT23_15035 [Chromatiaceae bacterium]
MSFASMHNDYLDPDIHLWQDEGPEDDEETEDTWDIESLRAMVAEYDNPRAFYHAVYEGSCGVTVTMYFTDGTSKYNNELPDTAESVSTIRAISVSSIVEGSDVEIEPVTPSNSKEFWEAVEEIGKQVDFYWKRDHTTTLSIKDRFGEQVCFAWWLDGDDHPQWDTGGPEQRRLVMKAFDAHWLKNKTQFVNKGLRYTVEEINDDSTY